MRRMVLVLVVLLLGSYAVLASKTGTFDRTLPVSGAVELDVKSDPGGVSITAGSTDSVRVHAVIRPLYGRLDLGLAEAHIRALVQNPPIEQEGNRIRIGYAKDPSLLEKVSIHLEIETPRITTARIHTESGGIRVDGIAGPVVSEASSGRVDISNVPGETTVTNHSGAIILRGVGGHVSARNESGGIQIFDAGGSVEAETKSGRTEVSDVSGTIRSTTHSGSIRIDNVKGAVTASNISGSIDAFQLEGAVQAESRSGAIRISQVNPAPIKARADSGAITVELANRGGYLIDALSNSGKVSGPAGGGTQEVAESHRLKTQIGAGGPLVDLDTVSSKIQIN